MPNGEAAELVAVLFLAPAHPSPDQTAVLAPTALFTAPAAVVAFSFCPSFLAVARCLAGCLAC